MKHYVPVEKLPISPEELRRQGRNPDTYYLRRNLGDVSRNEVRQELTRQGYNLETYQGGAFLPDRTDLAPNVNLMQPVSRNVKDGVLLAASALAHNIATGEVMIPSEHAEVVANRRDGVPGNQVQAR